MKLTFLQSSKSNWERLQIDLSGAIMDYLGCGKDFEIEFSEISDSKSWMQVKGIHKLAQLLAVRLTESNGVKYSMENAKIWIKWQFDFVEQVSEEEAIAEAINERNKSAQIGAKMTREQFLRTVESFKSNLKKPRSFATATKEEMIYLIKKVEELGARMGWAELKLTSAEMQSLVEFFNNKKE